MDKDLSEVPEVVMLPGTISGIPLKYGDHVVGTADMLPNGSIHAHIEWFELPKELHRFFSHGLADSLSIGPNLIPTRPLSIDETFSHERLGHEDPRWHRNYWDKPILGGVHLVDEASSYEMFHEQVKQGRSINAIRRAAGMTDAKLSYTHPYDQNLRISRAIELVYQYVKDHLDATDTHVTFGIDEVFVVWFCKTLQNWKALLSTTLPDGMYYEVTYDGDKKRTYIDAYKKFDNKVIIDDEPTSIAYAQVKSTEFGDLSQRPDPRPEPERTKDLSQYKNVVVPEIPAGDDRFA